MSWLKHLVIAAFFLIPATALAQPPYIDSEAAERATGSGESKARAGSVATFQKYAVLRCRDGSCLARVTNVGRDRELLISYWSCAAFVAEDSAVRVFSMLTNNAASYAIPRSTDRMFWTTSEQVYFLVRGGQFLEVTTSVTDPNPNVIACTISGRYL